MSGVKDEIGEKAREGVKVLEWENYPMRARHVAAALDDRDQLRKRVAELEAQLYQKQISIKDLGRLIGAAMNKDGTAVGEELNRLEESGKQLENSEDG